MLATMMEVGIELTVRIYYTWMARQIEAGSADPIARPIDSSSLKSSNIRRLYLRSAIWLLGHPKGVCNALILKPDLQTGDE